MRINYIDVDDTLCKSIFNNDRLKNDNKNCLKADFLHDLKNVEPYPWARHEFGDDINIIVTGRLPAHEKLTIDWFYDHCMKLAAARLDRISFVSVQWDDTKATREESYRDYCARKFMTLLDLVTTWLRTLNHSHITPEFHVYEDDKTVLAAVHRETEWVGPALHLHVVDAKGEVHDYP